jgi:hypothetical protein
VAEHRDLDVHPRHLLAQEPRGFLATPRTLRGHDDGVHLAPPVTLEGEPAGGLVVEGDLGDEDEIGAAGQPRPQGQLTGRAAHDLDDEHALERRRRVADAAKGVQDRVERGVESDRMVAAPDVVVDGPRQADDADAAFVQLVGPGQRAVAADDDQGVHMQALERGEGAALTLLGGEVLAPRGPQERAAAVHDPGDGARVEWQDVAVHEPAEAPAEAEHVAALRDRPARGGAHRRVHPRGVAAARQDADDRAPAGLARAALLLRHAALLSLEAVGAGGSAHQG